MKITRLEVSNFKRIRAVTIEPKGAVVQVRGKNGAGKSSVLDSIAALFGGEKLCPREPIRRGEKEAVVRARVDTYADFGPVNVERKFKLAEDGSTSSTLKLYRDDGLKLDKPQKRLDDLITALSFDPLAFSRLAPKEQSETLRKLAGVDFSLLDMKRRTAFDARTDVNRRIAAAKARIAGMPAVEAPDEPVSAGALLQEHQARVAETTAHNGKRLELDRIRNDHRRAGEAASALDAQIAALEEQIVRLREQKGVEFERQKHAQCAGVALRAEVDAFVPPNLDEIPKQLKDVEATNERVRAKKARAAEVEQLRAAEAEAARLTSEIEAVDEQKGAALAAAKFPVAGLAFDENGATFNGIGLEQSSQAEQLRISVAIGAALNPTLRAMRVHDGSLLDEDSLALLCTEAEKSDLQVWLEVVGASGAGVVIEDGMVQGAAAPAEAANA